VIADITCYVKRCEHSDGHFALQVAAKALVRLAIRLTGPLAESAALEDLECIHILGAILPLTVVQHGTDYWLNWFFVGLGALTRLPAGRCMCAYALVPAARQVWATAHDKATLALFLDVVMQLLNLEGVWSDEAGEEAETADEDGSGSVATQAAADMSRPQGRWLQELQMLLYAEVAIAADALASCRTCSGAPVYIETLLRLALRLAKGRQDKAVQHRLALHARRAADLLEAQAGEVIVAGNVLQLLRLCTEEFAADKADTSTLHAQAHDADDESTGSLGNMLHATYDQVSTSSRSA
jgi:hypothetical protein